MPVISKLIVSPNSQLSEIELKPFEQKIQKALSKYVCNQTNAYCTISVDGDISETILDKFYKVNSNIYIGFNDNIIEPSFLRAFQFDCISIKEDDLKKAQRIIVLISSNPVSESAPQANNSSNSEASEEDKPQSFSATKPKFSLDKVILDEDTRNQINRSLALIRNQKLIFDTWGFREVDPNTKTILCFFGAPGTGKTMCAHAIAKALGKNIMIASYASIESKWVGEGPKNMRKIFDDAREQDAILFFDEADSFLSKRVTNAETGSDKHYNRMSNEMFQLLEDFDSVVIFATNLVTDFDKAFKSRILSFVEFSLPDKATRAKLIQTMIPSKLPLAEPLSSNYLQPLANASEGFSGREIRKALLTSLSEGALNGIESFGLEDLLMGFSAINAERTAIEETATRERNIISDFLESSNQNNAIVDLCHWTLDQQMAASDTSKEALYKICRVLNSDMPDLSISYKNKDLTISAEIIRDANRTDETIIYIAQILANSNLSNEDRIGVMETAVLYLDSSKKETALEYFKSLNKLLIK